MTLRQYQLDAIAAINSGWKEFGKQVAVLPTGAGKTIIFSNIAKNELPNRTLILAHREELIDQARDKLHKATGIVAGREKAEDRASLDDKVVVASVQTMVRRTHRWPQDHFGLVIVDECHHTLADTYLDVLKHFHDRARVLGVTATADRGDKRGLGEYYENIAFELGLKDLIDQGYLAPITLKCIPLEIDISACRMSHGDYRDDDLGHALEPYLDQIAESIVEECLFRRVLIFLPLINTSMKMCAALNKAGGLAWHVDGASPDRKTILADFEAGRVDMLTNASLLFEGYDNPQVDAIVMLRPTRSRPLFAQAVGRGTRIAPYKKDLLLLDYLWLTDDHKLVTPASLFALDEADAEEMTKKARESQVALDLGVLSRDVVAEREATLRKRLEEKAAKKAKTIEADEFAVLFDCHDAVGFEATMNWELKPVTDKQVAMLQRNGIDLDTVKCRGHAAKLLDVIFKRIDAGLATPKQVLLLKKYNVKDAEKATFEAAKKLLDHYINRQKQAYQESYQ